MASQEASDTLTSAEEAAQDAQEAAEAASAAVVAAQEESDRLNALVEAAAQAQVAVDEAREALANAQEAAEAARSALNDAMAKLANATLELTALMAVADLIDQTTVEALVADPGIVDELPQGEATEELRAALERYLALLAQADDLKIDLEAAKVALSDAQGAYDEASCALAQATLARDAAQATYDELSRKAMTTGGETLAPTSATVWSALPQTGDATPMEAAVAAALAGGLFLSGGAMTGRRARRSSWMRA